MFNSNWRARCHGCLVKAKFAYVAETIEQTKAVQVDISGIKTYNSTAIASRVVS